MENGHPHHHTFVLKGIPFETITEVTIARYAAVGVYFDAASYQHITPRFLEIDQGTFGHEYGNMNFPDVTIVQHSGQLLCSCTCNASAEKLCEHEAFVLAALIKRDELAIFFNATARRQKLKKVAADYGLENEADLDAFFNIRYEDKKLSITPALESLIPVTKESLFDMNQQVAPAPLFTPAQTANDARQITCVVLRQHKYYKYLFIDLYTAQTAKDGKIKNPLTAVNPLDMIWATDDHQQLKFYTGINKFQNHLNSKRTDADLTALRAIVKNPLGYRFYYHNSEVSENITASSIVPVKVAPFPSAFALTVNTKGDFYEVGGSVKIGNVKQPLKDLSVRFSYFLFWTDTLYLADSLQTLGLIDILSKRPDNLLIHQSKFKEFKAGLLNKLEDKISVNYKHIKPATPVQLEQQGFTLETEKIIYLSDFGSHVMIVPVMQYGESEISIRTQRQIYAVDNKGKEFFVTRDDDAEEAFKAMLVKQHPNFLEQLDDDLHYFYLHKKHFLDEAWFLNVFEEWQRNGITILGFNELEGNKLNPNKVKITIRVLSGINWFNSHINVRFGRTKASFKQIYKSVRNKSKYVQLDDGTMGILPADWIKKFTGYFNSGEVVDDMLRTPKTNYQTIRELYDDEVLDEEVRQEIANYRDKFAAFESIKDAPIPAGLKATLRPYQQQGLNWLNFLDDFNFGGCLADDMGLGKTMQIIAFILSQRDKVQHNTNLLVVPTSLIFNWQQEVQKFAPSIRIHTIYGADRIKSTDGFDQYELILTSYGTLLADVNFIKKYLFNYIFLDESQNIKNPDSQRYKSVRLLKSRNKIVITGTPIENNTFDLYGQLSFACPGLLGTRQYFRDIYSVPIDKFKSNKRAAELHQKIKPFILRRTKQQVAAELPDKTEMVLYCDMQEQQRGIYNAYEKEFREYISATTDDQLKKSPMNVLKGLTKLRQICNSPELLPGEKQPGTESAKIDMLIDQIQSKSPEHKILVFSQFVSMLELIKKELIAKQIGYTMLTGSTRNREAIVNEFQNNAAARVFLISLKAGGTGLNLTEADYVYIVDPWWNPAVENQAIDRSHRIGQYKNVVAVRLICPDTVEEKIMLMQDSKKELVSNLIKTDASFLQALSKQELLAMLR
ncbi:DEAD/DEAH box helicase [Mucilaginibacter sp. ZB1P21]|uniref:DEAD/DEAH box helicase n=1 Tax=Mucilaginibacter glaciei TaxID=2772109 RepID=A0A926S134_9SPHI|nr:DEAD/DEAH box helicase [Mucilaginibacter glaciei]